MNRIQGNYSIQNNYGNKPVLRPPEQLFSPYKTYGHDSLDFSRQSFNQFYLNNQTSLFNQAANSIKNYLSDLKNSVSELMFGTSSGTPSGIGINTSTTNLSLVKTNYKDISGKSISLSPEAAFLFDNLFKIARSRGVELRVSSSYRSVEHQEKLFNNALKKYGSAQKARKWVAPPGKSQHNLGNAIDLNMYRNGKKISQSEFDQIISLAGFYRPMSYEGWHIEPLSTKKLRHK